MIAMFEPTSKEYINIENTSIESIEKLCKTNIDFIFYISL